MKKYGVYMFVCVHMYVYMIVYRNNVVTITINFEE